MDPISPDIGSQLQNQNRPATGTQVQEKAKSLGAPDAIISRGPEAIKAWAHESGIVKGAMQEGGKGAENRMNTSATETIMEQLEAAGISYDSYTQAIEEGPEATEALLSENDFSFDVEA